MKKIVPITFKSTLRKLFLGEHFNFYEHGIITPMLLIMGNLPMLSNIFAALQEAFAREDNLFKQSQAAFQTAGIRNLHDLRLAFVKFFWECVNIIKYKNDSTLAEAIARLEFLHHTYAHLPGENYYDMSGTLTNLLTDCEKPEYHAALQLLTDAQLFNLINVIAEAKTANDTFKSLYHERTMDKVQIAELGKLTEIRVEVDGVFDSFVDTVNVAWTSNELGAKDSDIRQHLLEVKEIITGAIQEAQLTLARRGHHKAKDDDKKDDGTQTPDATNPPAPTTPPQQPDTTLPAAPDTPDQNPVAVPPGINPEDLNPPPAGE